MTPSSLILILYDSSNKEALAKAFKHFSLLSISFALDKNLVRQKIPFFYSKSSFICSITFDKIESAWPCNYLSCGPDHLVTAYEVLAESIYNRRYLMNWVDFANTITLSSLDSMAFKRPDQRSFFSYRSYAFVPNSTFLSAERVLL